MKTVPPNERLFRRNGRLLERNDCGAVTPWGCQMSPENRVRKILNVTVPVA